MKTFAEDMKIMYRIKGKHILKEMLKIELMLLFFIGGLLYGKLFSLLEAVFAVSLPLFALIIAYFVLYFSNYRPLLKEVRRTVELEDKYEGMYKKFMRTN
jgi:uncharacterized membrane protein YoaK (UPF0700 family)